MSVLEDGKIDGAVSLSVERVTRKIAECSVRWLRKGGGIDPLHELLTFASNPILVGNAREWVSDQVWSLGKAPAVDASHAL